MTASAIQCTNCRRPYPESGVPHRCPVCGGVYNFVAGLHYKASALEPELPGIWPYRHTFPLPGEAPLVTLGEGHTPVEWRDISGRRVAFKLEYLNPTGSFKDRGAAVLVSLLCSRAVESAVEDSSGNAGAALAAYASAAGLPVRIFIPDSTSSPKRIQIEKYGAQVVRIMGPRSNAAEAVLREAARGVTYASHAYLPQALAGYATAAYESVEQLGGAPGTLVSPAGQGNLLLGMMLGYQALQQAGLIDRVPVPVGVQALACAPLWAVRRYGAAGMGWVTESPTIAEGVRVRYPVRGDALLAVIESAGGEMAAMAEDEISNGRDRLAELGFSVELTSAVVWQALQEFSGKLPEPFLVMLTGAGYKSP